MPLRVLHPGPEPEQAHQPWEHQPPWWRKDLPELRRVRERALAQHPGPLRASAPRRARGPEPAWWHKDLQALELGRAQVQRLEQAWAPGLLRELELELELGPGQVRGLAQVLREPGPRRGPERRRHRRAF